jgi:hypothetical protein
MLSRSRPAELLGSFLVVALAAAIVRADSTSPSDVLSLLEKQSVSAELTAEGAHKVIVRLRNQTDDDLEVEFPPGLVADAFAQNPVLAQFPGGGGSGSQGLGFIETRDVQVASGATVDVAFRTACLNYGIPEPKRSTLLFLKRVEDYSPDPQVHSVLAALARVNAETPVAQVILWRVANRMTWDQLSRLERSGTNEFSAAHLVHAQRWLAARQEENSQPVEGRLVRTIGPARPNGALVLAINPDPRGSKDSAVLVRAVARHLRDAHPALTIGYQNYPTEPELADVPTAHWGILVKTIRGADRGKSVRVATLSMQHSRWDARGRRWRSDAPVSVPLRALADTPESELAAATAKAIVAELAERSVVAKWSGAGKTRLAISNRLPVPLTSISVRDSRNEAIEVELETASIPAGRSIEVALDARQAKALSAANRLSVYSFAVQNSAAD